MAVLNYLDSAIRITNAEMKDNNQYGKRWTDFAAIPKASSQSLNGGDVFKKGTEAKAVSKQSRKPK